VESGPLSLRDHEQNRLDQLGLPIWRRLLRYVRPYWGFVALAMTITLAASAADYFRAYLLMPLFDEVILPAGKTAASTQLDGWIDQLPIPFDLGMSQPADAEGQPADAESQPADAEGKPTAEAPLLSEEAVAEQIRTRFVEIVIAAGIVLLLLPLIYFVRDYSSAYALGRIHVDMKRDVCAKLLALPLRFHQESRRGDVYARAVNDVGTAHRALDLLFGDLIQSSLRIFVGVAFLVYLSWQLSMMALVVGPLIILVITSFGRRIRASARKRQQQYGEVTQRLMEILTGIKVIKAFRAEAAEDAAYRRETRKLFKRNMKVTKNRLLARHSVDLMNHSLTYTAILIGIMVMGWLEISMGELAAFFVISNQTYRPVKKLAKAWVQIADASAGADRLFEVLDKPVDIHDAPDAVEIGRVRRNIRARGLSFSYGDEPVLENVDFEVNAGEMVAIIGRTGAGKTTLIDLLMRFYDPTAGCIEIDGHDLRQITRDSLLGQIAVVTQEPFLFDGTIWENLRYGKPDASREKILKAARAAHVDEFVDEMPDGYDTEVGATGVRLSGGQRQRITIARAILKDPSILILDEATSSLDSKSERFVQQAIDTLLGGERTVFVIAHRLSTIRQADRIFVIEDGTITQRGTHTELLSQDGLYRELLELQNTAT